MTLLSREELASRAKGRRYCDVNLPEIGTVRIQSLTERERAEFEASLCDTKGDYSAANAKLMRPKLITLCVVDAANKPLFKKDDIPEIAGWDGSITAPLFAACKKHCGFSADDLEASIKNSEPTQGDSQPSG